LNKSVLNWNQVCQLHLKNSCTNIRGSSGIAVWYLEDIPKSQLTPAWREHQTLCNATPSQVSYASYHREVHNGRTEPHEFLKCPDVTQPLHEVHRPIIASHQSKQGHHIQTLFDWKSQNHCWDCQLGC